MSVFVMFTSDFQGRDWPNCSYMGAKKLTELPTTSSCLSCLRLAQFRYSDRRAITVLALERRYVRRALHA